MLADIPGMIEGAHEGTGIGDRFLGHVERCRVLLHLVDGTQEDVAEAYRVIRRELEAYGHGLAEKQEIVALTKIDALTAEQRREKAKQLGRAAGRPPIAISAVSGENMPEVLRMVVRAIDTEVADEQDPLASGQTTEWRP